jgi:amphi-Trp domain-containing protein
MPTRKKTHILKQEMTMSRSEAAERLRSLADLVEAGNVDIGVEPLAVPEQVDFELDIARKLKRDTFRFEIEAELHWATPAPPGAEGEPGGGA